LTLGFIVGIILPRTINRGEDLSIDKTGFFFKIEVYLFKPIFKLTPLTLCVPVAVATIVALPILQNTTVE